MATGTGKTLTAAAVIKLFLRSGNARRVLFLVDRLELEDQAKKAFAALLSADFKTVIYKENRDDWRRAEIVVTTVQSLLFNNKYQRLFSPTDFDLVISDEAHRSIGGNARAVFDYFIGYKLGLTATPRDYLKKFDKANPTTRDPREFERRLLLDTYRTFGCENSQPTFRYSLLDGVKEGFLINPTVVDARTDITTQLLSEEGFVVSFTDDAGEDQEEAFKQREFEKRFFAEATNQLFCKTFLENALRDPISGEIGKSIIFAVSQNHAAKLAQILNEMADRMFPGKYQSDFAVQVTSQITRRPAVHHQLHQQQPARFGQLSARLQDQQGARLRHGRHDDHWLRLPRHPQPRSLPPDLLADRLHPDQRARHPQAQLPRTAFRRRAARTASRQPRKNRLQALRLLRQLRILRGRIQLRRSAEAAPAPGTGGDDGGGTARVVAGGAYEHLGADILATIKEETIGHEGMKIDRMFFEKFEDTVRENDIIANAVEAGQWDRVIDYVNREVFDKPEEYYKLDKLRKAAAVDRRLTLREILEKIFGLIPRFKSKDELLEEEFAKFVADYKPEEAEAIPAIKTYFKAYVTSDQVRHIIESKQFTDLATNPVFSTRDFRAVPEKYRIIVPEYVKDYVPLNQFAA